jgi:MarR family transcriptional repressor of emrRAB
MADDRLANVLGAFALALTDELDAVAEQAAGQGGAGAAALVSLSDLLAERSVDDLRRAVGLTHSGGVRVVDRLVAGGLAERRRGIDGRSVAVALTPLGHRLAERAKEARREAVLDVVRGLDQRELSDLTPIMEKLVHAVVARRLEARAAGVDPPGGWMCRLCDPMACERPEGRCPAAMAAASA